MNEHDKEFAVNKHDKEINKFADRLYEGKENLHVACGKIRKMLENKCLDKSQIAFLLKLQMRLGELVNLLEEGYK